MLCVCRSCIKNINTIGAKYRCWVKRHYELPRTGKFAVKRSEENAGLKGKEKLPCSSFFPRHFPWEIPRYKWREFVLEKRAERSLRISQIMRRGAPIAGRAQYAIRPLRRKHFYFGLVLSRAQWTTLKRDLINKSIRNRDQNIYPLDK